MGKITMQDIADALHISRVTVSKAFNEQAGVSDALREQIFDKARELGYTKANFKLGGAPAKEARTVSLIVSRPDSAIFWTNIIHRMAQELAENNINLLYTYVPSVYTKDFTLPAVLLNESVSGAIVLNVYDSRILEMINGLSIPKVFLDTVPEISNWDLDGDVLLIEGYCTELEITKALIEKGHREIGFLGDTHYAQTNMERYRGYVACMERYGLTVSPAFCLTGSIGIFSYEEELDSFLDGLTDWPDAFVCASDYVAHFVRQYMDEHPDRVPHPVVLTGFDNSSEYTNVAGQIITANVPTGLMGKRLAVQLSFRVEHPDAPHELTFIHPSIVFP